VAKIDAIPTPRKAVQIYQEILKYCNKYCRDSSKDLTLSKIAEVSPQMDRGSEPTRQMEKLKIKMTCGFNFIAAKMAKNLMAAKLPQKMAVTIAPSDFVS